MRVDARWSGQKTWYYYNSIPTRALTLAASTLTLTLTPTRAALTLTLTLTLTRYPGTVAQVHADGSAAIQYCDGDYEERVKCKHIRPTQHFAAFSQPLSKSKARPRKEACAAP